MTPSRSEIGVARHVATGMGRLSLRMGVPLVAIGVILAGIVVLVTSWIFQRELDQHLRRRAEALATAITNATDSAERAGQLQRFVTALGAERDIDLLMVVAGSPLRVVAANRQAWEDRLLDEIPRAGLTAEVIASTSRGEVSWNQTASLVRLVIPLRISLGTHSDKDLRNGVVMVSLDRRPAIEALRMTVFAVLGLELFVVAGLVGSALMLLEARVLAPLRIVHSEITAAAGPPGAAAHIGMLPNDEIGALGRTLSTALYDLALLRRAIDASTNAVMITDPAQADNPIVYVNAAYERITGHTVEATLGRPPQLVSAEGELGKVSQVRAAMREGHNLELVLRGMRTDGTAKAMLLNISPVRNATGELRACICIISDVTESLRQEEELSATKAFLDAIVDELPVAVFCKDLREQRMVLWNRAAELLFGIPMAQALGRTERDLFPKEQADAFAARDAPVIAGEVAVSVAEEKMHGSHHDVATWMRTSTVVLRGKGGQPSFLLAISEDISERRLAAGRLLEAHAQAEELLSILSAILIGIDAEGIIVRFNTAAVKIFGLPSSHVVGRSLAQSGLGLDWNILTALIESAISKGKPSELNDMRCTPAGGGEAFLDLSVTPARNTGATGRPSVVIVGFDVTTRRLAEAQRSHGHKLESIGQLAAGIAHEINTPIQFIGDNLRFLSDSSRDLWALFAALNRLVEWARTTGPDALLAEIDRVREAADPEYLATEMPKAIQQSIEGAERVRDIVTAMKNFSHPDLGNKIPLDFNHLVEITLTIARSEYRYVAEMVTDLDPHLPPVTCLGGEVKQVVLNLVVNAAHAIGDVVSRQGRLGTITVTTRQLGDQVELRVADTGNGIPEKIRQRIYDPFFTTKEVGRGTGQGLYLAYGVIVKKHAGTIRFETEEGAGTTFIITLPISGESASSA